MRNPAPPPGESQGRSATRRSERGAVLVHVAVAMIGLTAFSSFVIDYGVLWAARRQAQNAADAAAMAAAVSLGFVDPNDQALARQAALNAAAVNPIWGQAPDITAADITFPPCPVGAPGAGTNSCVRVDVFRNQRAGGSPLPTIFGTLVGVTDQGVRATATAEVMYGNSTNCVKPFAIPDKWIEVQTPDWDPTDDFERYNNRGALLPTPDVYTPPSGSGANAVNGTGFNLTVDYGLQVTIKSPQGNNGIQPGWYYPVVLDCPGSNNNQGAACYEWNIANCSPDNVGPGSVITMEPGAMVGPTRDGVTDLIDLDPDAEWDEDANDGRGGIVGGCMEAANPCAVSPRVVAVPVFNPDTWDLGPSQGRSTVTITRVVGMFVEEMQGNTVVGRLMPYPGKPTSGTGGQPGAAFVVSIILVR